MASDYIKVYRSFFKGSMSEQPHATRLLFLALLTEADTQGVVAGTPRFWASYASITEAEAVAGLEALSQPDPGSTSTDEDGRRIEPWGEGSNQWRIVNYRRYYERSRQEERREYKAAWAANKRAAKETGTRVDRRGQDGTRVDRRGQDGTRVDRRGQPSGVTEDPPRTTAEELSTDSRWELPSVDRSGLVDTKKNGKEKKNEIPSSNTTTPRPPPKPQGPGPDDRMRSFSGPDPDPNNPFVAMRYTALQQYVALNPNDDDALAEYSRRNRE